MTDAFEKDLFVLVADKDAENAFRGLFARPERLGIRAIAYELKVHFEHDAACWKTAEEFLRPFHKTHHYALVLFDRHGSGADRPRIEMEADLEGRLSANGWDDRCAAVVIDPELEAWVWTDSPHVERFLGWKAGRSALVECLAQLGFESGANAKPIEPKGAVNTVWRRTQTPRSAARFKELAEQMSVATCTDAAFLKLKGTLKTWFAAEGSL